MGAHGTQIRHGQCEHAKTIQIACGGTEALNGAAAAINGTAPDDAAAPGDATAVPNGTTAAPNGMAAAGQALAVSERQVYKHKPSGRCIHWDSASASWQLTMVVGKHTIRMQTMEQQQVTTAV
jgi:hypothetical protein